MADAADIYEPTLSVSYVPHVVKKDKQFCASVPDLCRLSKTGRIQASEKSTKINLLMNVTSFRRRTHFTRKGRVGTSPKNYRKSSAGYQQKLSEACAR